MTFSPLDGVVPQVHPRPVIVRAGTVGTLHLNGVAVGSVVVTGHDASWRFGRFRPAAGFEAFAPAYDLWSFLMHDDADGSRLDRATAANLAVVENAIDRIRARLFLPTEGAWLDLYQLTIDGELLEWKEY